jgi:hypothetical protein
MTIQSRTNHRAPGLCRSLAFIVFSLDTTIEGQEFEDVAGRHGRLGEGERGVPRQPGLGWGVKELKELLGNGV